MGAITGIIPARIRRLRTAAWVGFVSLLVLAALGFRLAKPVKVLPRLGPAPVFRLVDQDSRPVTHESFLGGPVLFSFFTTSPHDRGGRVMAEHLLRLSRLAEAGPDVARSLRLVTITVDPEHDTPERLRGFAQALGADPDRWRFLTGPGLAVKLAVGTGFGVYYESPPDDYDRRYVLVDGQGIVRAVYPGPALDIPALLSDLELLQQEAAARGAARLAYAAAHWFACYPAR